MTEFKRSNVDAHNILRCYIQDSLANQVRHETFSGRLMQNVFA